MVCDWGMSEKMGPLTFGKKEEQIFLGREIAQHRDYSEHTAQMIDDEIKEIVEGCYSNSKRILADHMEILKDLSDTLLERETLTGEEVDLLVKGEELPPRGRAVQTHGVSTQTGNPTGRFHSTGNSRVLSLKRVGMDLHLNGKPLIMGILNITPDSFSDGGHFLSSESRPGTGSAHGFGGGRYSRYRRRVHAALFGARVAGRGDGADLTGDPGSWPEKSAYRFPWIPIRARSPVPRWTPGPPS